MATTSVKRLYNEFKPENYKLELAPDAQTMHFTGTVTITGRKCGRPSQRLTFHQNGLKITSATVEHVHKGTSKPIVIDRINNHNKLFEVRLHSSQLLYPGEYKVTMTFEGKITVDMNGLYPCYYMHEGAKQSLLMTQFESHFARDVFPCIDEPEAKATYDMSIAAPSTLTVLANTPVTATAPAKNGWTTHTFATTPKMSSYLLAFIIGNVHGVHAKTKSGVEVGVWGTIAQPKEAFAFALEAAVKSIEFFEDYFDTPYPLAKADHVAVPDFSSGAMENWGLITYREVALLLYPEHASQSSRELIATVVGHETSHQWFGNLVTMKWWDDLWLNESFANMMEYRVVDALYPQWDIWSTFYGQEGLSALRRDALPEVQAIKTEVSHPDEINTLFDPSIVYAKGGRLLYMLMNHIGEDAFRKGLSQYFKQHAYQNTTGDDLWAALGHASNIDVGAFMNPWLDRAGFPVVHVKQEGSQITLRQEQFLDAVNPQAPAERIWPVPLFPSETLAITVMDTKTAVATSSTDTPVLLNTHGRGHYLVHYEDQSHQEAIISMVRSGALPEVDRLMLLNNSAMLAKNGTVSFAETLQLLDAYAKEDSEPVWDIIAVVLGDSRRFVDMDESLERHIKELSARLVQDQYKLLGWDEAPDESPQQSKLRATILSLGTYGEIPEILATGLRLFEAYKKDTAAVSGELRPIVFGIAVRSGAPEVIDYLLELHQTTHDSELRSDIAGALTSTKQETVAKRLFGIVTDPDKIKPQDADRWIFYMLRNRHIRTATWDWMVANWAWVEETYGRDKSFDYFPRITATVCNTPEWQQRFEDLYADKVNNPLLRRNILIGREEIAARIAWLNRDLDAVRAFFAA